jgi:hypothetical protein
MSQGTQRDTVTLCDAQGTAVATEPSERGPVVCVADRGLRRSLEELLAFLIEVNSEETDHGS